MYCGTEELTLIYQPAIVLKGNKCFLDYCTVDYCISKTSCQLLLPFSGLFAHEQASTLVVTTCFEQDSSLLVSPAHNSIKCEPDCEAPHVVFSCSENMEFLARSL